MSVLTRSGRNRRLGIAALALLGLGIALVPPAPAEARGLLDVVVQPYVPAPYYPHTYAVFYGSTPNDYPNHGGVYFGGGLHWH